MTEAAPEDFRALLGLFPLLMLFFAVEPRLNARKSSWASFQVAITSLGVTLSGVGLVLALIGMAFPDGFISGRAVLVVALLASTVSIVSAVTLLWSRLGPAAPDDEPPGAVTLPPERKGRKR